MKKYGIFLALVIMAGCSRPKAVKPTSIDEFAQVFSNRYESGQTETILDLFYDLKNSEYKDTLKWMATTGAGELKITYLQVLPISDPLPDGFQINETMSEVEPNLTFSHVLYCKASNTDTNSYAEYSFSWGVAEHDGNWYFPSLRKTKM